MIYLITILIAIFKAATMNMWTKEPSPPDVKRLFWKQVKERLQENPRLITVIWLCWNKLNYDSAVTLPFIHLCNIYYVQYYN